MSNAPPSRPRKVVFLGDGGVGKTSIILQAVLQRHPGHPVQTIGSSFQSMSISPGPDASAIPVSVWDTAGQERYAALVPYYSRGAER
jgi:small GTP-binding protein